MFKKKAQQPQVIQKPAVQTMDERTEKALESILMLADLITVENQRNGDLQSKVATNVKQHLQEVYGRFSSSKKLKGIYDNIYSIVSFPDEQLRFYLLNFYYAALDLFEKAKTKKETQEEKTTE